ncbi:hypothetical protein PPERSA_12687 [Pseudocohnilembus persalinus]|uniref:Uncharacterized protein n=1 Tax=Pseudocohnilembus persalinus TaxID=266149 RepID=A0A0V0QUH2_PSEPJ|nr:hypothetical protein PPERSA_12687 [Pseudocohnilembus persalinus]|eukprot:KRX05509.1 hypothetical protein PPERSA_12687 [Pseudocohnilembus persalinus]
MELTEEEILNAYKPAQNDNIPQIKIGNLRQYANSLYPISLQKKPKKKKKKLKKTNKLEPLTTLRKRGTSTQTNKNYQTYRSRAYTNLKPQYLNDELKPEIGKQIQNQPSKNQKII